MKSSQDFTLQLPPFKGRLWTAASVVALGYKSSEAAPHIRNIVGIHAQSSLREPAGA
jgi:hypothetical protein